MKNLTIALTSLFALSTNVQAATVSTNVTCGLLEGNTSIQAGVVQNAGLLELVVVTSRIYGEPQIVTVPVRSMTVGGSTRYFNEDQSVSLRTERTKGGLRGQLLVREGELAGLAAANMLCVYDSTITASVQ